ncbi:sine oculis-binding protein homolog B isoform X2 [Periophthalmus magnuspinnatus]|uniref:sine oculis-binding protein homolog B isoform X2 n=1 Tax=Periophthalmus magnuspinnatus TaxID=409849 RepID=UPI0024371807|nr:sine oculis-binding protein homolog B isoform X2 [Periophthalmus magnuspinnatus]
MPEMEKGRPAENKRSRKPAHPVKRELNQEMKTFAESTMNELLGWYGYDKVELRESEANEIRNYRERRQHVSVLKENSLPKPKESKVCVPSVLSVKPVDRDVSNRDVSSVPASSPSSSTSSTLTTPKELKSAPVIVPLIKPSAVEDTAAVHIVCVWCQKEGVKRYSLCMGSELKSFCSEKCFAACRRAYFKRNKARDEDLQSERSPQPPHSEDSPRLVLKTPSSARACDWCKHVRYTKEYLDFGSGEERLQFCSTKCLNQYKMDVFYREARAALSTGPNSESSPGRSSGSQEGQSSEGKSSTPQKLLTPESWTSSNGETRHRKSSPKMNTACESPPEPKPSGSRTLDRPTPPQPPGPPPAIAASPHPIPALHPPHHPSRPMLDHPHTPPMPMPFIRPPLHAQGLKSPLTSAPRHPGPPSSPIHRPPHSPHLQPPTPAAAMNPPGLMHPFPGAYFPGLHSPPLNMLPRGPVPPVAPVPMPPMMNYGIPSFSPLLPHPTVLVPYPVIVPLPVPIPIPIPIPLKSNQERSLSHSGVIQPVPEGLDRSRFRARPQSPEENSSPVGDKLAGSRDSPSPNGNAKDWVKSERSFPSPSSTPNSEISSPGSENLDYKQSTERHVIQRVLHRTQVKVEPSANGVVDLSALGEVGVRPGNIIRSVSQSPPPDKIYHLKDPNCSPKQASQLYETVQLKSNESATNGMAKSPNRSNSPLSISPEEVKENKCQNVEPQTEEPVVGDVGEDPHVPDEDHAYALPTTPKSSGTITPTPTATTTATTVTTATPLLLPKLRDKGSLRTAAAAPPTGGDMEPALKRRCLRLREQNK